MLVIMIATEMKDGTGTNFISWASLNSLLEQEA